MSEGIDKRFHPACHPFIDIFSKQAGCATRAARSSDTIDDGACKIEINVD
jgi:hypothetical protein